MGHMIKLMGNISPTPRETFLTLMKSGGEKRWRGGGGKARFTGSQTPVELQ